MYSFLRRKPPRPTLGEMNFRALLIVLCGVIPALAGESLLFRDDFKGRLAPGWSFVRENTNGWRVLDGALQIRIESRGTCGADRTTGRT
jgi:hypothetical protein